MIHLTNPFIKEQIANSTIIQPKVWGVDAQYFRPERWLKGTPEEIKRREMNAELVFGYGKWQCLGKNVAQIELNKVFVEVNRCLWSYKGYWDKCADSLIFSF